MRPRTDGWTPDRQREFVEALADCGVLREAAARVGMSEQSVARLRRRPGSASFAAACEVALRIAPRRLRSVAYERAVEGTIKRHYYHGELKAEERVFDNRLLMFLLEKSGLLCDPAGRVVEAERGWPALLDAVAVGGDAGAGAGAPATVHLGASRNADVWQVGRKLWTRFPPPDDFRGTEDGMFGEVMYRRTLTDTEIAALDAREDGQVERERALAERRRDRFFGFAAPPATE